MQNHAEISTSGRHTIRSARTCSIAASPARFPLSAAARVGAHVFARSPDEYTDASLSSRLRIENLSFAGKKTVRPHFPNPIGLAAGFDQKCRRPSPSGHGSVSVLLELGTITPRPQPGNPRPRVFPAFPPNRLINRLGFPSRRGEVARRLEKSTSGRWPRTPVGLKPGQKQGHPLTKPSRLRDLFRRTRDLADYRGECEFPNTPGPAAIPSRGQLSRFHFWDRSEMKMRDCKRPLADQDRARTD